ncbi:hypothetical protein [Marinobacter santoriniensis]|nr:hypothetical protein [Marinobacter santoriniensis]
MSRRKSRDPGSRSAVCGFDIDFNLPDCLKIWHLARIMSNALPGLVVGVLRFVAFLIDLRDLVHGAGKN